MFSLICFQYVRKAQQMKPVTDTMLFYSCFILVDLLLVTDGRNSNDRKLEKQDITFESTDQHMYLIRRKEVEKKLK